MPFVETSLDNEWIRKSLLSPEIVLLLRIKRQRSVSFNLITLSFISDLLECKGANLVGIDSTFGVVVHSFFA